MATEMEKLGETSDDDEEDLDMDVKEEDEEDARGDDEGDESDRGAYSGGMMIADASADDEFGTSHGSQFQPQPHIQICIPDGDQQQNQQAMAMGAGISSGGMRRCRPKEEKERTKLRERHRRAITARILSGLRRHGSYNLRVRADINEVIAALAREAGWTVLSDGTTFPARANSQLLQPGRPPGTPTAPTPSIYSGQNSAPLRGVYSAGARSTDFRSCQIKGVDVPGESEISGRPRASSVVRADRGGERATEGSPLVGSCMDGVDDKQGMDAPARMLERDFAGTPYVPVYVMLPLGVINMKRELVDPEILTKQLRILKSANVDGVMVDCWWGIVEAHSPQEYNWQGYKSLFQIVRDLKLKLQVVMSFHECGGNVGDDVYIPLPHWVREIGRSNPDIFFTDREGRRNTECLTWGIDKERVLRGRTAVEAYFDFMRSFRVELDEFFEDGVISEIQVGLGPCGELRYPSYPARHGWRYPGIGEFQCYDKYMTKSLRKAAEARGHVFWARGPDNAGSYNSQPHETGFFRDGGDYDSYYGRFFLGWYSRMLTEHADRVLSLAKLAFEGTHIAAKVSGIHWWYKTASHAAELTAGFYNPCNRDGYVAIAAALKKHDAALNFTCVELRTLDQHEDFPEALADPEGLVWQVLNAAWDEEIAVASENALPCYDREGYGKILENAKPFDDPDGRHLSAFTYLRLSPVLMEAHNFPEFERFVRKMHGEAVLNSPV